MELQEAPPDIVPYVVDKNETFVACEACGAKSWYFAIVNGTEIGYCKHHADRWETGLLAASKGNVRDYRYLL